MLRRERVFERDIFRLGTGTVLTPLLRERFPIIPYSREIEKLATSAHLQALL